MFAGVADGHELDSCRGRVMRHLEYRMKMMDKHAEMEEKLKK